jgi:phage-related protein
MYDGVASEQYGLYIQDIDANAVNSSMGSSSMEIMEQKIYRRATPYFFGATPSPKLAFDFSAYSDGELDADTFEIIQKWLFSSRSYKKFQIDQPDIQSIYFNAILNAPKIERVGNIIQGFSCSVECDSPFAYHFPKTTTYPYTASVVDNTVVYNNRSDDVGAYLYPKLVITMNNIGGTATITNASDSNRVFSFTGLSPSEVLTVDCSLEIISSSTGLKRLGNFNKHFLRLVPYVNSLRIQGNIASIAMTTQFIAKKISG